MEINKINKIGNYSPSGHNASSIVDTEGIAPAVMENHGTVTAIVEPKAVSYTRDKDGSVTDRHHNDVFNTIHTGTGGGGNTDCYIAEPMCSVHPLSHAKEFNPKTSIKTISPALRATDYKCPHCVYEPRVIQVGNLYPDTDNFKNRTVGRVYSADGLSPTLNCCGGGDREPKIIAMRGRNPDNPSERGKSNGKYRQRMEVNKDGVSNTLTSVQKDNLVAEPLLIPEATAKGYAEAYDGDSVNLALPNSKTRRGRVGHQQANTLDTSCNQGVVVKEQFNTIIGNKQQNPHRGSVSGVAPCITSACGAGGGMTPMLTDADLETTKTTDFIEQLRGHQELRYRIRKLTPRECFRLMDVSEPDIDKLLNAGISNSQLYKLAGNSIVVSCLYHIFRKMFIEPQNENQQLTLF